MLNENKKKKEDKKKNRYNLRQSAHNERDGALVTQLPLNTDTCI